MQIALATYQPPKDGLDGVAPALGEFDVVLEAAGTQSAVTLAGELVREHGRIALVGYHTSGGGQRQVNMERWNYRTSCAAGRWAAQEVEHRTASPALWCKRRTSPTQEPRYKAIDVVNGHVRRDDEKLEAMQAAMHLLAAGRLRAEPLVTAYALADAPQAFRDLADRKPGLLKAILVPEN